MTSPAVAPRNGGHDGTGERTNGGPAPESRLVKKNLDRLDWDTIVIWLFIISLIVISLLTAYQFRAKLSLDSP